MKLDDDPAISTGDTMLKLVNVTKTYRGGDVRTRALDGINLEIEAGEYLAITGPSGCGKSTLLAMLGLLDTPDSGEYWIDGREAARLDETRLNRLRRGRIGFIFQNFNLIEALSVQENVELALQYMDVSAAERRRRAGAMLDKLGVAHRARHRPSQLSGGQQQRVAIARALVPNPAVLLADEPTGNLDSRTAGDVLDLFDVLHRQRGMTIVMVTHGQEVAERAARIVRMRDGRIVD